MIIREDYPIWHDELDFGLEAENFEKIISAIKAVRNIRTEMNVPHSIKAKLYIETSEAEIYKNASGLIERLAWASNIETGEKFELSGVTTAVTDSARIFIPLSELVDREKELKRLSTEKKKVQKDLDFLGKKLSNEGFLKKAPAEQVQKEKDKLEKAKEKMAKIELSIKQLG